MFDGLPHTLYLPIGTSFTLTTGTDCEVALFYSRAEEEHPARLIGPEEVEIEVRGGGNATRQINQMIQPGFAAHRRLSGGGTYSRR